VACGVAWRGVLRETVDEDVSHHSCVVVAVQQVLREVAVQDHIFVCALHHLSGALAPTVAYLGGVLEPQLES
jgi:hypothetical protein